MAATFTIGGQEFHRRSTLTLAADEKAALRANDEVTLRRAVGWPLAGRVASFDRAYADVGGTDLWGPGPYLKVPNRKPGEGDGDEVVNRVFCPWGYPPDNVRVAWSGRRLEIVSVELVRDSPAAWEWRLTLRAPRSAAAI